MDSRRLIIYLTALLVILLGMLVFILVQTSRIGSAARGGAPEPTPPDLVNGGSIYEKGENLAGRMIPVSGGPVWYQAKGGGCVVCHGPDGRGGKPVEGLTIVPPNVSRPVKGVVGGMSIKKFTGLVKWGERPGGKELSYEMPRYDVPEQEMIDLMEYIKQL